MKLLDISLVTTKTIKKQKQFWKMQYNVCRERTNSNYTEKNIDNEFVAFENWKNLEDKKFEKEGNIK